MSGYWVLPVSSTTLCVQLFFKIFDFRKNSSPGFLGSGITKLTSILPYAAFIRRYTTKMSAFRNYPFYASYMYFKLFSLTLFIMLIKKYAILYVRICSNGTEESAMEFAFFIFRQMVRN